MWWRKTAQRAQPDCGFSEPEPPLGGEAYTILLCAVKTSYALPQFIYLLENPLNRKKI
jgi:hypothetical protein